MSKADEFQWLRVRLPKPLVKEIKHYCINEGIYLSEAIKRLVEAGLREGRVKQQRQG